MAQITKKSGIAALIKGKKISKAAVKKNTHPYGFKNKKAK